MKKKGLPKKLSDDNKTLISLHKKFSVLNPIYNCVAFILGICSLPFLLFMYIGLNLSRFFWFCLLEYFYPELEIVQSTTVRSTVDTLRNQGIITVVLQVKGSCDINQFIFNLQKNMVNRKKEGKLLFPHLRKQLTSLWGWYAWKKGSEEQFNITNHVTMTKPKYSSEFKDDMCQKIISDMVSKYISPEYPPWQLLIIPSLGQFYVLIRLHHLYLSEDRLGLGELLLLEPEFIWSENTEDFFDDESVLAGIFKMPVAIPQVYQHICESLSNSWNELVSVYDPLENPKISCNTPTLKSFFILLAIVVVSTMKGYMRSGDGNLRTIMKKEINRRRLTGRLFWRSLIMTFHPMVIGQACLQWTWWISIKCCLHLFRMLLHIPIYVYWTVLCYHVLRELWYLSKILFVAPKVLLEDLLFSCQDCESHHLQTVSLCGRKSVSWSKPVPLDYINRIHLATGASSCEIFLAGVCSSLRDYFQHLGFKVPSSVMTTARFIPQEKLLAQSPAPLSRDNGLLCITLPLSIPSDGMKNLDNIQSALYMARIKQAPIYLASLFGLDHTILPKILPSIAARICLNILSKKFAVTLTQVDARSNEKKRRRMLWGQEVESIMYWRTPQANISLSLTLMSYGESVRLGVMSDTQLAPQHTIISDSFTKHITELATLVGVEPRQALTNVY